MQINSGYSNHVATVKVERINETKIQYLFCKPLNRLALQDAEIRQQDEVNCLCFGGFHTYSSLLQCHSCQWEEAASSWNGMSLLFSFVSTLFDHTLKKKKNHIQQWKNFDYHILWVSWCHN